MGYAETKGAKTSKSKKKNRRKKIHSKVSSDNECGDHKVSALPSIYFYLSHLVNHTDFLVIYNQEANSTSHLYENGNADDGTLLDSGPSSESLDPMSPFSPKLDFDDGDIDDELDPAMKEELDRFVGIFCLHS